MISTADRGRILRATLSVALYSVNPFEREMLMFRFSVFGHTADDCRRSSRRCSSQFLSSLPLPRRRPLISMWPPETTTALCPRHWCDTELEGYDAGRAGHHRRLCLPRTHRSASPPPATMRLCETAAPRRLPAPVTNLYVFRWAFPRTLYTDDGVTVTQTEVGGNGTVNMTGGSLTGSGANGLTLRLGGVGLAAAGSPVYTGIFNQSGGTVTMGVTGNPGSIITIGSQGTTPTPTSVYNLSGGTIGVIAGSGNNNGINVRNGTFNMTGGSIVTDGAATGQRAMTISSTSGTLGSENVATANFSGGIVDVNGGMRMAPNSHTKAYVTISGTADLKFASMTSS